MAVMVANNDDARVDRRLVWLLEEEAAASGAEADGTDEVNHQCDPVHSSNNTLAKPAY